MLSTSCIEKTRRSGTLENIEIFCFTFSVTGLGQRQAMMWGTSPACITWREAKLGGLGFLFAQRLGLHDVGESHDADAVLALFVGQFTERLDEVAVFVIADGAADFDEDDVGLGLGGQVAEDIFYLAGDVGNHLDVAAEVAAVAFAVQDAGEDLAAGGEVDAAEVFVEHALIGAQVHVGFHAVVEDEHFAVAEGIEGARIEVEVAFHLDGGDLEALVLEDFGQGRGEDALAQAGHDGAHDDDVLGLALDVALGGWGVKLGFKARVTDGSQQLVYTIIRHDLILTSVYADSRIIQFVHAPVDCSV